MNQLTSTQDARAIGDGEPSADEIAAVLAGVPTIGEACDALRCAGWQSSIAGNRISVNHSVFARFIGESVDPEGRSEVRWIIYETADHPAVRIVVGRPHA